MLVYQRDAVAGPKEGEIKQRSMKPAAGESYGYAPAERQAWAIVAKLHRGRHLDWTGPWTWSCTPPG